MNDQVVIKAVNNGYIVEFYSAYDPMRTLVFESFEELLLEIATMFGELPLGARSISIGYSDQAKLSDG